MPKKNYYLYGGIVTSLNWAQGFFNQANKYIKNIQKIPIFMFSIIGVFCFLGSVLVFNYFIQEILLKIFCLIAIVVIFFMGFYYYDRSDQRNNEIEVHKKIEKITRGLKDE